MELVVQMNLLPTMNQKSKNDQKKKVLNFIVFFICLLNISKNNKIMYLNIFQ